jgi:uncharacterized damage-inducible protein DinB
MNADKLLKHMAWANKEILTQVSQLPDAALDSYVVNPEWTAREIVRHICSSATWYGYRLLNKEDWSQSDHEAWNARLAETEIQPALSSDVLTIAATLEAADAELLRASQEAEGVVLREVEGKVISRARSTVISQAIHHATEHRAQLVAALEAKGYTSINLDDYDLWAYSSPYGE